MIPMIKATGHEAVCPLMSWRGEGLRFCDTDCALMRHGHHGWAVCSLGGGHAAVMVEDDYDAMPCRPEITDDDE